MEGKITFTGLAHDDVASPQLNSFQLGWEIAASDLELEMPWDNYSPYVMESYWDGYTARWFPVDGSAITCGNRMDLPRKQRVHFYVCLGYDIKNKGIEGICEVLVFACATCGRDWR